VQAIRQIIDRARAFERDAHGILGVHEASKSRVVLLEETYNRVAGLSLKQDELFREALSCTENALFRAAHVMAWAGFIDFVEEKLASDGFVRLRQVRPNWTLTTVEDVREYPEYQIIDAAQVTRLCSKPERKALHGLLSQRNECAHPSSYDPGLNETLGYISQLLQRLEAMKQRKYP